MTSSAPISDSAASKITSVLKWLGALIALCLTGLIAAIALANQEAVSISAEREQAQLENALATKLADMRGDLTSVTFWDEAVERTAIRFDAPWADENIGEWLAEFYGVDESYVLDGTFAPTLASAGGKRAEVSRFEAIRSLSRPLVEQVAENARSYVPGQPDEAYGAGGESKTRGLDAARFARVGGKPVFIIVAPLLPDFGRLSAKPRRYHLLVAVHHIDAEFLSTLEQGLLLKQLQLDSSALTGGRLPLAIGDSAPIGQLSWVPQQRFEDLVGRILPLAAGMVGAIAVAGALVLRFVRRSAHEIFVTRFEATHDELTGLANRRLLTRELELALGAPIVNRTLALLFIDLDRFKEVNDIWGHAAGDVVIRTSAVRIAQAACGATVARFGGDEFVVLVEGDRPEAEKIADEILRRLREPHAVEGTSVVLAGSIGIALSPEHGVTASELMRRADLALYRAKELGKDRLVLFNHEMDHSLQARQQLEQDLRAAIDAGEISVVYQPQVCRDSGRMIGVEALARWCHVTRGDVSPAVFVPIAEEAGLIRHLDRLVLRSACSAAAHWDDIMVSVNVSPIELRAPTYASEVRHVLLETGLPPRRLKLEITETALLTSASTAAKIVQELRAMGVKLTLDDFGTGYSSLDHLRTLKLDGMKIDRSFVANLGSDADSHALVVSIIALGHALGLSVTAEGVETDEQLALLQAAGCDEFQGYLVGRPVNRRTIEALIERQSADNFHADDLSLGGVLALPLTVLPSTA